MPQLGEQIRAPPRGALLWPESPDLAPSSSTQGAPQPEHLVDPSASPVMRTGVTLPTPPLMEACFDTDGASRHAETPVTTSLPVRTDMGSAMCEAGEDPQLSTSTLLEPDTHGTWSVGEPETMDTSPSETDLVCTLLILSRT
ncbi:uncharacterized protein LOC144168123 [Haemaphysalis longicornis]